MEAVRGSYITTVSRSRGSVTRSPCDVKWASVFDSSEFMPAADGSWLMVDWIRADERSWSWYVIECDNINRQDRQSVAMKIGERFGHTGKVEYQYGHAFYHFRVINGTVYRFGVFTYRIDGRKNYSREAWGTE